MRNQALFVVGYAVGVGLAVDFRYYGLAAGLAIMAIGFIVECRLPTKRESQPEGEVK